MLNNALLSYKCHWGVNWYNNNNNNIAETAESAGAAANNASANKIFKYSTLASTHHFVPISVETGGPWNSDSSEFIAELGKRISQITLEPFETQFLSKGCPYRCRGKMN